MARRSRKFQAGIARVHWIRHARNPNGLTSDRVRYSASKMSRSCLMKA